MNDLFPQHDLDTAHADTASHSDARKLDGDAAALRRFMLAGKATVTLRSVKTGTRFTYRITQSDDGNCHFVGLLTGPNNQQDYKYIGRIARGVFWIGRKVPRPGDLDRDTPSVKAFDWTWRLLASDVMPQKLEVWHEGYCGRCGLPLTVPESIAAGYGPTCIGLV